MNKPDRPPLLPSAAVTRTLVRREGVLARDRRTIPEETAVAFTYGRASYAVMMATPADLEDFAVGFSLSEGIVEACGEITELEIMRQPLGVELRMALRADRTEALDKRRRIMAGPAGCGLCGIESLSAAVRSPNSVHGNFRVASSTIFDAMAALRAQQPLNRETRAVHGAGFWSLDHHALVSVREDVGRHNALDKLIGALARAGQVAGNGFIVLTSRVSIELVQKAAAIGSPMLVAVSAPTAYAVRAAEEAGLTLVAVARDDSFEVFCHRKRVDLS